MIIIVPKWVDFPCHLESISIERNMIVGFKGPRNHSYYSVYSKVLLKNGSEITLNGIWIEDAEKIVEQFDERASKPSAPEGEGGMQDSKGEYK